MKADEIVRMTLEGCLGDIERALDIASKEVSEGILRESKGDHTKVAHTLDMCSNSFIAIFSNLKRIKEIVPHLKVDEAAEA